MKINWNYPTSVWIGENRIEDLSQACNNLNISSVEMTDKAESHINFKFNLIIRDLKNFTNLISELKQRDFKFKIIRHDNKKKNAFKQKILKYFKKN